MNFQAGGILGNTSQAACAAVQWAIYKQFSRECSGQETHKLDREIFSKFVLLLFLASSLLICCAASGIAAASTNRAPVIFKGIRGINVFGPLGGPVSFNGSYPEDPYSNSLWGPVASHITPAVAAEVKAAGFDFVRLQVDVGPCVQAVDQGRQTVKIDMAYDAEVAVFERAGLKVLFSPYFSNATIYDRSIDFLRGTGTVRYQNLVTCEQHWAARYIALYSPILFALDLFNEPPLPAGSLWQTSIMPSLYASIREAAPHITLVITPENYGDFILLAGARYYGINKPASGIDPRRYRNALFTFHQFLPSVFADQGESYNSAYKYITGLSFPPRSDEKDFVVRRMVENVDADTSLAAEQKADLIARLTNEIGYYIDVPEGPAWLNVMFGQIRGWCSYWGLRSDDVLLGEWGAPRRPTTWLTEYGQTVSNADSRGSVQGADRLSIVNYDAAVQQAVSAQGFRSAVDHLDTYDLGQTVGVGAIIGVFDPLKLKALTESPAIVHGLTIYSH